MGRRGRSVYLSSGARNVRIGSGPLALSFIRRFRGTFKRPLLEHLGVINVLSGGVPRRSDSAPAWLLVTVARGVTET